LAFFYPIRFYPNTLLVVGAAVKNWEGMTEKTAARTESKKRKREIN